MRLYLFIFFFLISIFNEVYYLLKKKIIFLQYGRILLSILAMAPSFNLKTEQRGEKTNLIFVELLI